MSASHVHQNSRQYRDNDVLPTSRGPRERSKSRERPPRDRPRHQTASFSEKQFLAGLTIAGLASTLLSTTFNLFHLDTFLTSYKLTLGSYARGNIIYTTVDTVNGLIGAWFIDSMALRSSRSSIVGRTGCLFAFCFMTPFFRWKDGSTYSSHASDATHFAVSMSLYDTMNDFSNILYGSMFTDYHELDERGRVGFMASGKIVNMFASFGVARIGLSLFSTEDLSFFRYFVLLVSLTSCGLFILAQETLRLAISKGSKGIESEKIKPKKKLKFKQVARDFLQHKNFRVWIVVEMLLECQTNFSSSFLKIFVDHLLLGSGYVSEWTCNMILSSIPPLCQVAGICLYVPIHNHGYRKIYMYAYQSKFMLSLLMLTFGSPESTFFIASFLTFDMVLTGAVQSAGFHLAMGDMVAEMKLDQMKEGRLDEPSLAGLFIGANALMCKPMGSFLPLLAAWSLAKVGFTNEGGAVSFLLKKDHHVIDGNEHNVQRAIFYLLVLPPLTFSFIQGLVWRMFDLDGKRAEEVRSEVRALQGNQKYNEALPLRS